MDFHLAVVASALRRAADDLDRRYAEAPRTLEILHSGIAAAYRGLSDAWGAEIPAEFLPGFLAEDYADAQAAREAFAEIEVGADPVPWEQVKADLTLTGPAAASGTKGGSDDDHGQDHAAHQGPGGAAAAASRQRGITQHVRSRQRRPGPNSAQP